MRIGKNGSKIGGLFGLKNSFHETCPRKRRMPQPFISCCWILLFSMFFCVVLNIPELKGRKFSNFACKETKFLRDYVIISEKNRGGHATLRKVS